MRWHYPADHRGAGSKSGATCSTALDLTNTDGAVVATDVGYKTLEVCALYFSGDGKLYKTNDVYAETPVLTAITVGRLSGWSASGTTLFLKDGFAFSQANCIAPCTLTGQILPMKLS